MSTANITVASFELTPVRVSFKGPSELAFTDLGGTIGNVAVSISYKKYPLKADQAGTEPIDHKVGGLEVKVTTTIAEIQDKAKWKIAFPHATAVAGTGAFSGEDAVDFFTNLGDGGQSNAGELLLHPLSKADADKNSDYLFYKACAMAASEVVYGPENQLGLKVEWFIYPDMANAQKYMRFGDADLV